MLISYFSDISIITIQSFKELFNQIDDIQKEVLDTDEDSSQGIDSTLITDFFVYTPDPRA